MKQKRNFPVGITAMQATEGTNPPPPHPTPLPQKRPWGTLGIGAKYYKK